jgi:hypothetical protein
MAASDAASRDRHASVDESANIARDKSRREKAPTQMIRLPIVRIAPH